MTSDIVIRRLSNGALVFSEGDEADGMYVILEGKVRIFRSTGGREATLAILSKGELFGETALFDRQPRSDTAEVLGEAVLRFIGIPEFEQTIPDVPLRRMLATMSERLRRTDELAARLEAENEARHEWIERRMTHREWVL